MRFPLNFVPPQSWHSAPRSFGAPRGKLRKHAGCDLYGDPGTPIHAVADGKVLSFTPFYADTHALTVDHGDFIVRYGEVDSKGQAGIKPGAAVQEGDLIGHIGDLTGITASMLHFEMYAGTASGPLTVTSKLPFMRRSDLLNPTTFLDGLAKALGGAGLEQGDKGPQVLDWQTLLLKLGYAVALDGDFGPFTAAATREFQSDLHLPMTGIADPETITMAREVEKK